MFFAGRWADARVLFEWARYGAAHAGVAFVPWSLGTAVGAGLGAGLLGPRLGRPTLHLGAAIWRRRLGMLAVVGATGADMTVWQIAGPELVAGAGMGMLLAPLFDFVLAGVEDDEVGSASGVLNATQQLSGAIGIAAIGTVFFSVLASDGIQRAFETALWIDAGLLRSPPRSCSCCRSGPRGARPPEAEVTGGPLPGLGPSELHAPSRRATAGAPRRRAAR